MWIWVWWSFASVSALLYFGDLSRVNPTSHPKSAWLQVPSWPWWKIINDTLDLHKAHPTFYSSSYSCKSCFLFSLTLLEVSKDVDPSLFSSIRGWYSDEKNCSFVMLLINHKAETPQFSKLSSFKAWKCLLLIRFVSDCVFSRATTTRQSNPPAEMWLCSAITKLSHHLRPLTHFMLHVGCGQKWEEK